MSELINYIKSRFKDFEPFMYDEITSAGYSLEEAEELVKARGLKKLYEDAYYYTESVELQDVEPDPTAYAYCKYIFRKGKMIGYFSNLNLDNMLSISPQCPVITCITSNLVKESVECEIGYLRFILFPPFALVTDNNVSIQMALDVIYRGIYPGLFKYEQKTFRDFLQSKGITTEALKEFILNQCAEQYRDKLLLNLKKSRL